MTAHPPWQQIGGALVERLNPVGRLNADALAIPLPEAAFDAVLSQHRL